MSNDSGAVEFQAPAVPKPDQENPNWGYTARFKEQFQNNPLFEEKYNPRIGKETSYFAGRPIIHRDSPINGGVYLVGGNGEAAVVDDTKDDFLKESYKKFRSRLPKNIADIKNNALNISWHMAKEEIPYNQNGVDKLHQELDVHTDRKISLGSYIGKKAGVCRHQSLLAGYYLEKLTQEGVLRGKVSVDRNIIEGKGGHAWVRYTNSANEVYVLDPAQSYIGKLENAPKNGWDYRRPEDRKLSKRVYNKLKDIRSQLRKLK